MFVVISHMTALLYWRLAAIGLLPMPQKCQIASLEDAVSTIKGFSQEDFAWMYISPANLAERGIVVREALEPGLRLCVENGRVPKISELLDVGNMPMGAEEVRRRVLHALVKQAWTAVRQADRNAMGQACVGGVDGAVRTATGSATQAIADSAADELANGRPSLGFEFPTRLDLLVGSQRARRTSRRVRSHVWKGDVPPGSLFRVNDSVLIVSPELLLAQLAEWRPADPHVVAVLGFELAGSYALLPRELIDCSKRIDSGKEIVSDEGQLLGDGYAKARPVLRPAGLAERLGELSCRKGRDACTAAGNWILAGSESPLETDVDVQLIMPRWRGGFNAGTPQINETITLSREASRIYDGRKTCRADALFHGRCARKIDVEPGGDAWHGGAGSWRSDNKRRQALEKDGYEVLAISWDEFADFAQWSMLAERLADRLGRGMRAPSDRVIAKQRAVHEDLCDTDLLRDGFGKRPGEKRREL